jgi:hypothetical protein
MKKEYNKEEYNKLCAEFMGYKLVTPEMRKHPEEWISSYWENPDFNGSSKGVLCSENGLQYNTNWNWIMEVVEKINSVDVYKNNPSETTLAIIREEIRAFLGMSNKEAVVHSIWEFLNLYNDNK